MIQCKRVLFLDDSTTIEELWVAGREFGYDKLAVVTSMYESRHGVTERLSTIRSELEKRLPHDSPLRDELLCIAPF